MLVRLALKVLFIHVYLLTYRKPVYMARLVQEASKHGETRLELSCRNPVRPNNLTESTQTVVKDYSDRMLRQLGPYY